MDMPLLEWMIVGGTLVLLLLLIWWKKLLKPTAIVTGLIASLYVAYLGGVGSFFAIIVFFLVGEFITRAIRDRFLEKPHGRRSTVNIVGNIGPSLIALTINPVAFNVMFFASLSAAFADTLSSEIGVLSKEKPLLITTLKPANPGEDGAVSPLGFVAAAIGGVIFGLLAFILTQSFFLAAVITLAGMVGAVLDSVLGATLQRKGYIDNNTTNFISAFAVGLFFAFLF